MSRLTSDESFKQLIYIAQQYLNKLLTPTDCQILGNLYSNLGFSGELLEYLIEYCVQNHHTSLRYMEKVALGWHKRGIKDVEQAKASGRGYTKGSFAVMRAMGLSDRGAKRRQASAGSSRSSNRFHNLEEHGYDYDEMVWSMINGAQKTGGDDGTQ